MRTTVFVKINRYKEVENTINQIKNKMQEARDIIAKISQFKAEGRTGTHCMEMKT